MSASGSDAEAQVKHLLEVVERHRQERCTQLLEQARSEAQQVLQQAHGEARARMHQDILDVRAHVRQKLGSAEAKLLTEVRQRRQRTDRQMLTEMWEPLREVLLRRWQQRDTRQQWIDALVRQASAVLIGAHWVVEHPADWSPQEHTALEAQLSRKVQSALRFETQYSIAAGLRICAGGACVDGTVEGLLRERTRIEALLLARIHERRRANNVEQ